MNINNLIFFLIIFFLNTNYCSSQKISKREKRKMELIKNPLAPSKAAFYSAILPGLGQVYTRNTWKVPLVYAAIGSAVYSYSFNKKEYTKYRNVYKRRISGFFDDEYSELIPQNDKILQGMEFHQRNRDLSFIFIIGTYLLNILEANVSAHLMQFNVNNDLSFKPKIEYEPLNRSTSVGFVFKLKI